MAKATKKSRQAPPLPGAGPPALQVAPRSVIPGSIDPMLCTLTRTPIADPEYLHEIKWDGYRIVSYVRGGIARLDSRSALDYTKKYPKVVQALRELGHDAVLDGEVVVFNEFGVPDFDALQIYNGHNTAISYCVFDLLWLDGKNLMGLPLESRKNLLADNLEGIVSKRRTSV